MSAQTRRRNPRIPCKRCGHTRAQHVDHGVFGAGRCKHCSCPRYSNGREKNPAPLRLGKWVRLPGGGAVRLRRQGRGRVLEYRAATRKRKR